MPLSNHHFDAKSAEIGSNGGSANAGGVAFAQTSAMQIRECLCVLLLASSSSSAVLGQEAPPRLQDAERAFADSLMRHDQPAFIAMFASDAESSLPVAKHGPEAIASAWLPFLIDPGTTMVLTSSEVITEASGDIGHSTGAFAIRGRTGEGIRTIPIGTYAITWRTVDGHWRISTLGGSVGERRQTASAGGVGRFRFGMTRAEVSLVSDCQPYTSVQVTGGLECEPYLFDGQAMNISFLFTGDRLHRIQLWFYDGTSDQDAREAVTRVLDYLQRTAGEVTIAAVPGMKVTPDGVMNMLNSTAPQPGRMTEVKISTPSGSQSEVWSSGIARHELGYLVMLFADPAISHH